MSSVRFTQPRTRSHFQTTWHMQPLHGVRHPFHSNQPRPRTMMQHMCAVQCRVDHMHSPPLDQTRQLHDRWPPGQTFESHETPPPSKLSTCPFKINGRPGPLPPPLLRQLHRFQLRRVARWRLAGLQCFIEHCHRTTLPHVACTVKSRHISTYPTT